MPESTSLSALRTFQPCARRVVMKLAADGSTTTVSTGRPAASSLSASAYSASVICRWARRESK